MSFVWNIYDFKEWCLLLSSTRAIPLKHQSSPWCFMQQQTHRAHWRLTWRRETVLHPSLVSQKSLETSRSLSESLLPETYPTPNMQGKLLNKGVNVKSAGLAKIANNQETNRESNVKWLPVVSYIWRKLTVRTSQQQIANKLCRGTNYVYFFDPNNLIINRLMKGEDM